MDNFKNKTEGFNVEELGLQEELALSLFEVEELEKRYEMGWIKGGSVDASIETDFNGNPTVKVGGGLKF